MSSEKTERKYQTIRKDKIDCYFWFLSPLVHKVIGPCDPKHCILPQIHPSDTECRYRPLLRLGMLIIEFLRRILLPAPGCGFAVVHAKEKEECDPSRKLVRACDLPIYAEEKKCVECSTARPPEQDTIFTETIRCVRKELWFLMDQARIVRHQLEDCVKDVKANTQETLDYLREENNIIPRMGAIGVGGLAGYILALRRGFFRKLFYTSIGAGGMAALCYPREAKEYSQEGVKFLKRYIIIGYHFLNGDEVDYDKLNNETDEVVHTHTLEELYSTMDSENNVEEEQQTRPKKRCQCRKKSKETGES